MKEYRFISDVLGIVKFKHNQKTGEIIGLGMKLKEETITNETLLKIEEELLK